MPSSERNKLEDNQFGLPKQRRFPLNDEKHVMLAIKFFSRCEKKYQKELATNIIKAIRKFGMQKQVLLENNAFKNYISDHNMKI